MFIFRNRFADRDMGMRYYWGEGVGHVYFHNWDEQDPKLGSESDSLDTPAAAAASAEESYDQMESAELDRLPIEQLPMDDDSLGRDVSDDDSVLNSDEEDDSEDDGTIPSESEEMDYSSDDL